MWPRLNERGILNRPVPAAAPSTGIEALLGHPELLRGESAAGCSSSAWLRFSARVA